MPFFQVQVACLFRSALQDTLCWASIDAFYIRSACGTVGMQIRCNTLAHTEAPALSASIDLRRSYGNRCNVVIASKPSAAKDRGQHAKH